MALGFAGAALMTFVAWNFLPLGYDELYEGPAYTFVWPVIFSSLIDYKAYPKMDLEELAAMAVYLVMLGYGVLSLLLVPLWKILHASKFISIPLAIIGMLGGLVLMFGILFFDWLEHEDTSEQILMILIFCQLIFGSTALFVFKNELELRNARSEGR